MLQPSSHARQAGRSAAETGLSTPSRTRARGRCCPSGSAGGDNVAASHVRPLQRRQPPQWQPTQEGAAGVASAAQRRSCAKRSVATPASALPQPERGGTGRVRGSRPGSDLGREKAATTGPQIGRTAVARRPSNSGSQRGPRGVAATLAATWPARLAAGPLRRLRRLVTAVVTSSPSTSETAAPASSSRRQQQAAESAARDAAAAQATALRQGEQLASTWRLGDGQPSLAATWRPPVPRPCSSDVRRPGDVTIRSTIEAACGRAAAALAAGRDAQRRPRWPPARHARQPRRPPPAVARSRRRRAARGPW